MIIDVSMYIFEALLFLFYCYTTFNNRYNKSLTVSLFFVTYGFLFGVLQIGNIYANMISNIVACIILLYFLFETRIISAIFHSIIFYAFLVISEYITIPLISIIFRVDFESITDENLAYMIAAIASKIIHLVCCMIILSVYRKIKHRENKNGFSLMLLIPIFNIVMFELIVMVTKDVPYKNLYTIWIVCGVLMLISSLLVFFNRYYIIKQANKVNELEIENKKKDSDKQYLSVLEKANDDMQILAHDFKNHLSYVRHLDSADEKDRYIDKVYPEIEKFQQTAATGNKTLDVILSKYTSICQMKAIAFKTDVKNANLSQVESVDLISLLNNLLDNAVEVAEQSKSKRITLTLVKDTQFIDKLVIANSCDTAPAQSGEKLLTRKKEGALHGTGLKSVKKVCEQYGANYAWQYDSEVLLFTTTVLMPKEQKSN